MARLNLALEIFKRSLDRRYPDHSSKAFDLGVEALAKRSLRAAMVFYEVLDSGGADKKTLRLSVGDIRKEGLEARWGKSARGGRCLQVRDPSSLSPELSRRWHDVDAEFRRKIKQFASWREAFDEVCGFHGGGQSALP